MSNWEVLGCILTLIVSLVLTRSVQIIKQRSGNMVIETKLEYGDKIYFIHGNPKKSYAVYSATIHHVTIFETGVILYHFVDAKVEVDKDNITSDKCKLYGYFYEKDLDSGNSLRNELGLSALPVFSSKKLCKEYLKRQKNG